MSIKLFKLKKPVLKLAIGLCFSLPLYAHAELNKDMADMFNSMGSETNYTQAGAFHGQAGSLYTSGSFSVRNPSSSLTPMNIQLPSIQAGCGGIDFFGGAFSFANKEQFIAFTRNLGNQAAGVAFDLALKALDPMIQDAIGGIRDMVNRINQANLESCEAAKQVAGGVMGMVGTSITNQCQATSVGRGSADDGSDARWMCQFGNNLVKEADHARGKDTPQDTISFTGGNLAYQSLRKKYGNLSDDDMDILISLTGTVVFAPPKEISDKEVQAGAVFYPPTIRSAAHLLNGTNGNAQLSKQVTLEILQCRDGAKKMRENCTIVNKSVDSIKYKLNELIGKMPSKISANTAWTSAELSQINRFISNSSLPVLRLAISDAYLGQNNLKKPAVLNYIGVEYAIGIINKYERDMFIALNQFNKLDTASEAQKLLMLDAMRDLRVSLSNEKQAAMRSIEVEQNYANAIKVFDDQWRSQFVGVANAVDYDKANRLM